MSTIKDVRDLFGDVSIKFITSAAQMSQCPEDTGSEFALLGRSNVGKSSLINHIFYSTGIAKVSKQPGKTRLANFFSFVEGLTFVDLPGYGYARVSHEAREEWSKMIKEFCEKRENLAGIIWLLDYRRENGTAIDKEAAKWLGELNIPIYIILTKSDKLNKKEQARNLKSIKKVYEIDNSVPCLQYSTTRDDCRVEFWKTFHGWVGGPSQDADSVEEATTQQ